MNSSYWVCFDLETSSVDTQKTDIWQIAGVAIEPRTLEILEGESFKSYIRPHSMDGIKNDDPAWNKYKVDTMGASRVNHIDVDTLKDMPTTEQVIKSFAAFTNRYGKGRDAPISLGYNSIGFDLPIIKRYSELFGLTKRGKSTIFNSFQAVDLAHVCFGWFENSMTGPDNFKLDTLRDYFGISRDGAHEALKDVIDTANIYVRFLKLQRMIVGGIECKKCKNVAKTNFKGAFKR